MTPTKADLDYYSYKLVNSYNAAYNVIVGLRGVGKTYGFKEMALDDWFKSREQFWYLRRYIDDTKLSTPVFFDDIAHAYPYADFRTRGNVAEVASAESRNDKRREWDVIGHFGTLSVAQRYKSTPYPAVTKLCFDEFIQEKGGQYLSEEVRKFNNLYSTIDRWNDRTKAYLLANAVSMANPFFLQWKVRPEAMTREFQRLFSGFMVIHFPDAATFKEQVDETRYGKFIRASSPEFAEFAIDNKFSDAHLELIDAKTPNARPRWIIETKLGAFSVWHDSKLSAWFLDRKIPKGGNTPRFTIEKNMMGDKKRYLEYSAPMLQVVRTAYGRGRVYFNEPATRNAFYETLIR